MIDSFPLLSNYRGLIAEDFSRFSQSFAEILKRRLPTAQTVHFADVPDLTAEHGADISPAAGDGDLFEAIRNGSKSCAVHKQSLMLAFPLRDGGRVIATVRGADPVFLSKVREDWLEETRAAAEREFVLLKEARVDVQTGLLNLWNLCSLLEGAGRANGLHLVLIELPPKRVSFQYVVRYAQKCATSIRNFIQGDSVLHAIGQSTFALVLPGREGAPKAEVESALVAYLKREGCHKVHVGSSFSYFQASEDETVPARNLLDEAWTALGHAEKRGPFSFCDYNLLAHPERHALAVPDSSLIRRLGRLSRHSQSFSVVHFRDLAGVEAVKEVILPLVDRGVVLPSNSDVLVFLEGVEAATALVWAKGIIDQASATARSNKVSAGVAYYPCSDFKKSETLFNCQKALLHASFFGDSAAVVFDSVSLNISGDSYFGDGDLARAVREYKRGLKFDWQNVNLHNSLGVALAIMDKLAPAMQSFENALTIDNRNFMALYNLGLAEQGKGRKREAYQYLEMALQHYNDEDAEVGLVDDLKLQLGGLACDLGEHRQALEDLLPWQEKNKKGARAGRVHFYIGKACHGLGDNRRAMVELQRALQFNEFDDRAMDLLGSVYFQEGEGDEIALALCQKSVELEPGNLLYRCNLAELQLRCGRVRQARENLYRCLKSKKSRMKSQVLLGRSFAQEGLHKRAASWFEKALKQDDGQPELYAEAKRSLFGK